MDDTLQNKLYDKYPEFGNKWYCEHGPGWYEIINALLAGFVRPVRNAKDRYDYAVKQQAEGKSRSYWDHDTQKQMTADWTDANIAALKEKYDTELASLPIIQQVKEKFGTLRFYVHRTTDANRALIDMAEYLSSVTCEDCGNRGVQQSGGWIKTLCHEHAEARGYYDDADEDGKIEKF